MLYASKRTALHGTSVALILAGSAWCASAEKKPAKVFILAGQSNMEGVGTVEGDQKGTLRHLVTDPTTAPRYKHLIDEKGAWVVRDDVWVRCLPLEVPKRKGPLTVGFGASPRHIGPEFGFGLVVGEALDQQVLLIKIAWGGRSLAKNFRPYPSRHNYHWNNNGETLYLIGETMGKAMVKLLDRKAKVGT
jgi:alpha-galactosidase